VEREGRTSGRVTITAPQGGIVWEIGARDGMAVMPGTNLVRIAGLGSVWLIAEVPEAQAGEMAIGMPVEVRTTAYPDRVFQGADRGAAAGGQRRDGTVRARVVLSNAGRRVEARDVRERDVPGCRGEAAVLVAVRGGDTHRQA